MTVALTLITKPGCHLCDDARETVAQQRELLRAAGIDTELEELNILDDPALARVHSEDIPVVLINGRRHAIWRVDPDRFHAAVERAARRRFGLRRRTM